MRHFKKEELPDDIVNDILEAGRWVLSPKNRQHWHFIIVRGDAKEEMITLMQKGVERTEKGEGLINAPKEWIADAYRTIHIMQDAPDHYISCQFRRERPATFMECRRKDARNE